MISIIVAKSVNNVIGKDNTLPWNLPNDLQRFKKLTINKAVIMGRKTFDSLKRPLPNRLNIVVTSTPERYKSMSNLIFVSSLNEGINVSVEHKREIMIIGGGEIYKQAMEIADVLYVTHVFGISDGDTFFPEIGEDWISVDISDIQHDNEDSHVHIYETFEKKR